MGAESFYLNIQFEKENMDFIDDLIKLNKIYSDFIDYNTIKESNIFSLQASKVNFFPICEIIYDLCNKMNKENLIISIETLKEEHLFNFKNSLDFFCWMYNIWKEQLCYFYKDWGAFLINPTKYYKSRRRLRKKYYIKFSLDN